MSDHDVSENPQVELAFTRTHMANERTFAAWLRTGLSLAAAGLAIAKLGAAGGLGPISARWAGITLVVTAVVAVGVGWWGYASHYKELRYRGASRTPVSRSGITGVSLVVCALLVLALLAI